MLEPGSRRIGLGVTLAVVIAGCLLQILLVPHELEGVGSAASGELPDLEEIAPPRIASVTTPPSRTRSAPAAPAPRSGAAVLPAAASIESPDDATLPVNPTGTLEVMGPSEAMVGELVTFSIVAMDMRDAVYAPLVLGHDPEVLGFVAAEEGGLFSRDGAETQFVAAPSHLSGEVEIAISRVPPASGIEGGGVLASATFLVVADGKSRISVEGSRMIDPIGRTIALQARDATLTTRR